MKYLLGLILSFVSVDAIAGAIPFPRCIINNQPVSYISVSENFAESYAIAGKEHIAGSNIVNGRPIIDYNPSFLSEKPTEWNLQVMLHECAHLKLHSHRPHNVATKEYEADCHSAHRMKTEYGYKNEDFDIVIETMKEVLPADRITAFKSCLNR
jgi:hypothetical protein